MVWQLLIAAMLLVCSHSQAPVLDGFSVTFSLGGLTSYTPNSGISLVNGYTLTLGFMNHEWMAVEIKGTTSDIIVVQQNPFYTANSNDSFSGHIVTIGDYHLQGGNLVVDTNTTDDLNAIGYMKSRNFSIKIKRALSSHSGEDWDANRFRYSMTQVCFYTGSGSFNTANWQGSSSVCTFYEVANLISTFRGIYLKDIKLNGYAVGLYGYIGGPYVTANVFYYHSTPLYTYNKPPAIVLELGAAGNANTQDFNVFSSSSNQTGDYFGSDMANMRKDVDGGGFENNGLTATYENVNASAINSNITTTNVKVSFSRNISTFDPLDKQLLSTFTFCIYVYNQGSIAGSLTDKYCDVVELTVSYPKMTMPVRTTTFAGRNLLAVLLALLLLALLL